MKLKSAILKFLTNKWVLNVVAFLALFNVIGYAVIGNLNAVLSFIIIAGLVRYFSKNMTIVLGIPLLIVNLVSYKGNMVEGMDTQNSAATAATNGNGAATTNGNGAAATNGNGAATTNGNGAATNDKDKDKVSSQGLIMSSVESSSTSENNAAQSTGGEQQGFEPGRKKNRGHDIDYATTIENAYDDLNTILGGEGIQRLTSDTQNLMKQQMQLAEAMKSMGPVIDSVAPMVKNLQGMMGQLNGNDKDGLGGLMNLAKSMSGAQAK